MLAGIRPVLENGSVMELLKNPGRLDQVMNRLENQVCWNGSVMKNLTKWVSAELMYKVDNLEIVMD